MTSEFKVEKVTHSDKEEIEDLCSGIWNGNDYIPDVFDDWVEEGGFYCGKVDGEIIAVSKYSWQRNGVIWLEGLRVHPDHQGQGYGKKMGEEQWKLVKDLDYSALRFLTREELEMVREISEKRGFEVKKELKYFRSQEEDLEDIEIDDLKKHEMIEREDDVSEVIDFVFSSEEYELNAHQYLAHWVTYDIDETLIREEVENENCFSIRCRDGIDSLFFLYYFPPYDTISVPFISGTKGGMKALLEFGLRRTLNRDASTYSLKTASDEVAEIARSLGMESPDWGNVLLYEKKKS